MFSMMFDRLHTLWFDDLRMGSGQADHANPRAARWDKRPARRSGAGKRRIAAQMYKNRRETKKAARRKIAEQSRKRNRSRK